MTLPYFKVDDIELILYAALILFFHVTPRWSWWHITPTSQEPEAGES